MRSISVSDFRQQCLALMHELPSEGIVITRHGCPIAKLIPIRPPSCADLIGTVAVLSDNNDYLFSTGERWDAES